MKISKNNKKYIIITLTTFFAIFIGVIFIFVPGLSVKGLGYTVQYGGRIVETMPIEQCSNPYSGAAVCALCSMGPWFQVVIQPSGGSGFYFCPTFPGVKGNNPLYLAGGYVITGGSEAHVLDPNNTASVLKTSRIKGNLMLAWFRIIDLFS